MEGIPIRNARRGDIPSLMLLWEAMMQEVAAGDPRFAIHARAREHRAAEFQRWLQDENRLIVVAEEGGRLVVGFGVATREAGNGWQVPQRFGSITDLFVVKPRRRMGIGRRLTGRMLDLLFEAGLGTIRLAVSVKNEEAHAFWTSMGWQNLEVVLQKEVPPTPTPAEGPAPDG